MRPLIGILALYAVFSVLAFANPTPFDPQILIDTGGDATNIDYFGQPITVGPQGGGIFVFHNATGNALTELDLNLEFPMAPLPPGFTVDGTIPINPSPFRQHSQFVVTTFSGFDCLGNVSTVFSCVQLKFILMPGPLIGIGENFVLDFNNRENYTDADFQVLEGTYTGGDLPEGIGGWAPGGIQSSGNLAPVSSVPEPGYRTAASMMCLALLGVWNWRRRASASK